MAAQIGQVRQTGAGRTLGAAAPPAAPPEPAARRSDQDIEAEVEAALRHDAARLREDLPTLRVTVRDGTVTLRGYVVAPAHGERARAIALSVHGVAAVQSELVTDEELETAVAQALAHDPRTHALPVDVRASHGAVHLSGAVPTAEALQNVVGVAAAVPHVRALADDLHLAGAAAPTVDYAAMRTGDRPASGAPELPLPAIGAEVYGADGPLGRVLGAIMDLHTRRVTGIVVGGLFASPGESYPHVPAGWPQRWMQVAIPLIDVEVVTQYSVVVRLDGGLVAALPPFDERQWEHPPAAWGPPLDYHPAEVWVHRGI